MRRSHSSSNDLKKVKEGAMWLSVFQAEAVACAGSLLSLFEDQQKDQ